MLIGSRHSQGHLWVAAPPAPYAGPGGAAEGEDAQLGVLHSAGEVAFKKGAFNSGSSRNVITDLAA